MVDNLHHRTTKPRNNRYDLRGQKMHQKCRVAKSFPQRRKDRLAARISNNWPITRANNASRGIHRIKDANECFRIAAIQGLLHLPKFMNWILTHNENDKFPCHPNIKKMAWEHESWGGVCAACSFKNLIQSYWGDDLFCPDGPPKPFDGDHFDVRTIHNLDDDISGLTGAEEQQDAEECQWRLLRACRDSVNHDLDENNLWKAQFDALFMMDIESKRQCTKCRSLADIPLNQDQPRVGFQSVGINQHEPDTLPKALPREKRHHLEQLRCKICGEQQVFETFCITGAPEILRIKLNINLPYDPLTGTMPKNKQPVKFPQLLDLTHFQNGVPMNILKDDWRLQYSLSSVLPHEGSTMMEGHWAATVRGPEQVFAINDNLCLAVKDSFLNTNPQKIFDPPRPKDKKLYFDEFEAVVLTYVRHPPNSLQDDGEDVDVSDFFAE